MPAIRCMCGLGPSSKELAFECLFNGCTRYACLLCFCYTFCIKQNKIPKLYAYCKFQKEDIWPAIFSMEREETQYLLSINFQKGRYFPLTPLISWLSLGNYVCIYLHIYLWIQGVIGGKGRAVNGAIDSDVPGWAGLIAFWGPVLLQWLQSGTWPGQDFT